MHPREHWTISAPSAGNGLLDLDLRESRARARERERTSPISRAILYSNREIRLYVRFAGSSASTDRDWLPIARQRLLERMSSLFIVRGYARAARMVFPLQLIANRFLNHPTVRVSSVGGSCPTSQIVASGQRERTSAGASRRFTASVGISISRILIGTVHLTGQPRRG